MVVDRQDIPSLSNGFQNPSSLNSVGCSFAVAGPAAVAGMHVLLVDLETNETMKQAVWTLLRLGLMGVVSRSVPCTILELFGKGWKEIYTVRCLKAATDRGFRSLASNRYRLRKGF
jgi:hypothetical protein